MNTPKYYTQVLANLDAGTNPKSREAVIREYFRLYLPSFTALAPNILEDFIAWTVSYEEMLLVFEEWLLFQEARRQKRVAIFDTLEEQTYWPRSLPPLPRPLTRNPFDQELARFREAFGPRGTLPITPSRVPGTTEQMRTRFANLGGW